jgi:hypothetical protein
MVEKGCGSVPHVLIGKSVDIRYDAHPVAGYQGECVGRHLKRMKRGRCIAEPAPRCRMSVAHAVNGARLGSAAHGDNGWCRTHLPLSDSFVVARIVNPSASFRTALFIGYFSSPQ